MPTLLITLALLGAPPQSLYDVEVHTIDGKATTLAAYRGKALVIVNTASRCDYTPQYKDLEALYRAYQDRGLVVLAFPSNDFGGQEPGSNEEIRQFCRSRYRVTFPLFAKAKVTGPDAQPLYRYLAALPELGGEPTWNFNKYLVAPDGTVVAHLPSGAEPDSEEFRRQVEAILPGADAAVAPKR